MLKRKILCDFHDDSDPSMAVYDDGHAWCYVCNGRYPAGTFPVEREQERSLPAFVEDLNETLAYIESLPKAVHRGLLLPYDATFLYIVWPTGDYYKKRFRDPTRTKDKYRSPTGHSKPLFVASEQGRHLLIVEGELNALSIASLGEKTAVVSPGSAGDFSTPKYDKHLPTYAEYASIKLIVDDDRAGVIAAIELKSRLIALNPHVSVLRMAKDANEILSTEGPDALRKAVYGET